MSKCQDCDYFGGECKTPEIVCEKYIHTAKTITKLDSVEDGVYRFSKLEAKDDTNKNSF